jgi:hypothetical protein
MNLASPLVSADEVEPVWFGLVDHPEDVAIEADATIWCGGEDGQIYRGRPTTSRKSLLGRLVAPTGSPSAPTTGATART